MTENDRKKVKFRFYIAYQTKWLKDASSLVEQLDLGMNGFGLQESFTFLAYDVPVQRIKDELIKVFEQCDIRILHIEGWKIE